MNKTNLISFDSFFLSVDDGIHRGRIMSGRFRILVGVVRFIVFLGPSAFFSSLFITSDIMLVYLMKEKVGGKEGERTFSSSKGKN